MSRYCDISVFQTYCFDGEKHSSDVVVDVIKKLGGHEDIESYFNNSIEDSYIETGIIINNQEILASNAGHNSGRIPYAGTHEFIFYILRLDSTTDFDILRDYADALKELESKIKFKFPNLKADKIKVFSSYG